MNPSKHVVIDYDSCRADDCGSSDLEGCPAEVTCAPGALKQEEPGEPPMLPSPRMCIGCGDCIKSCSFGAITTATT